MDFRIIRVPAENDVTIAEQRVVRFLREVLSAKGLVGAYKKRYAYTSNAGNKHRYKRQQREYHEFGENRSINYRSWLAKLKERRNY